MLCETEVARVSILVLFLSLEKKLSSVLPFKYDVSCGVFTNTLYRIEVVSFSFPFSELFFYHESLLNISNASFASIEILVFVVLYSNTMVYIID